MRASDRAYRALMADIIDGQLKPGTILGEVEQASRLGVSRTPLREALNRLQAEGFLETTSARSLVVSEVSLVQVRELYELREALEMQAAKLAAQRGDREIFQNLQREFESLTGDLDSQNQIELLYQLNARLDAAVDAAINNEYLVAALRNVRTHMARIRRLATHNPRRLAQSVAETLLIIEAIASGDSELAASSTQIHLRRSLANVAGELELANNQQISRIKIEKDKNNEVA